MNSIIFCFVFLFLIKTSYREPCFKLSHVYALKMLTNILQRKNQKFKKLNNNKYTKKNYFKHNLRISKI